MLVIFVNNFVDWNEMNVLDDFDIFCIDGFNSHLCALGVLHIGEYAWPANIRAFSTFVYDQCDQDVDNVNWTEGYIYVTCQLLKLI